MGIFRKLVQSTCVSYSHANFSFTDEYAKTLWNKEINELLYHFRNYGYSKVLVFLD